MTDFRVKFCCCCVDLKTGVLIWGYFGIIGAIVNFLESFLNPVMPVIINSNDSRNASELWHAAIAQSHAIAIFFAIYMAALFKGLSRQSKSKNTSYKQYVFGVAKHEYDALIFVAALISSICLVIAIHKNVPDLILITLLSYGMAIILLLIAPFILPSILPNPADLFSTPEKRDALRSFLDTLLITSWISAVIGIYFCIVIYSQFKNMKEEEANRNDTTADDMPPIQTIA